MATPILVWTANNYPGEVSYQSNVVEHGVKDNKGRAIGNYACIRESTTRYEEVEGQWQRRAFTVPVYYRVTTQATRDGKTFGAISTGYTEAATLEEAQAIAAKKVAAAGRRFARQVARGEGKQFTKAVPS
jgi:hypothetical protein